MKGILVKTGKYRDDLLKKSKIKPDMILDSISQLREYLMNFSNIFIWGSI
jgi:ribonucleotide monophosphatase NagD (HAD superfamily)